jgi:hypothetical protein
MDPRIRIHTKFHGSGTLSGTVVIVVTDNNSYHVVLMAVIKARILPFLRKMETGSVMDPESGAFFTLDTGSVIRNRFFSGSGIWDPEKNLFRITDPVSRVKKAPDPNPYFKFGKLNDKSLGKKLLQLLVF